MIAEAPASVKPARPRPVRFAKVLALPPEGLATLRLTETAGRKTNTFVYYFRELPADFGRGFELRKADGTAVYHVNVNGRASRCECKGFLRWNHCKHVESLTELIANGRLPAAPVANGRIAS
jgi:hypothetical protein